MAARPVVNAAPAGGVPRGFVRSACGKRGADVRPDFNWNTKPVGARTASDLLRPRSYPGFLKPLHAV
jgi:hypothetical protein